MGDSMRTSDIEYQEGFIPSKRGVQLCTSHWRAPGDPRGLILLCHGYSLNCSKYFQNTARALASAGYAVYGLDQEGHGKSEGTPAIVWSLEALAEDASSYFKPIRDSAENMGKPKFVIGESLGAGVAQLLIAEEPEAWTGAILMAPLFIMSPKISPPPLVLFGFAMLAKIFPTAAVGPNFNLAETANEDPDKKIAFRKDELIYQGNSRLQSLASFFAGADKLQANVHKITTPLLVIHGDKDVICEVEDSKILVERAGSKDKSVKVYPGMWHLLTEGASAERAGIVLNDMVGWLKARS